MSVQKDSRAWLIKPSLWIEHYGNFQDHVHTCDGYLNNFMIMMMYSNIDSMKDHSNSNTVSKQVRIVSNLG